jgi:hypothetical protein
MARLLRGKKLAGSCRRWNEAVLIPFTNSVGSYVGHEAMASTAPSLGSSTTADPAGAMKNLAWRGS